MKKVLLLSFVGGLALWAGLWFSTPALARAVPGTVQGSASVAPPPVRSQPVRTAPRPPQYRRTQEQPDRPAPRAYSVIEVPGSPGPHGIGYYHLVIRDGDRN